MKKSKYMLRIVNKPKNKIFYLYLLLSLIPIFFFLVKIEDYFYPLESNYSDLTITHLPNLIYIRDSLLQNGQIPFWSEQILSGYPFLANPLSGIWYLPIWLIIFLPQPFGFNFLFLAHIIWGGAGVLKYLNKNGRSLPGALTGAMVFVLMPKLFAQYGLGHATMVFAVCWTPWLLLSADRKPDTKKSAFSRFGTGLILGIILLTDVRWAAYSAGFIFLYNLFLSFQTSKDKSRSENEINFKKLFYWLTRSILSFFQQMLISILIAAPMLLPMLQYTSLSTRSSLTSAENLFLSLSSENLLGLFFPDIGGYAEWVIYFGAFTIFVIIGCLSIRNLRKKLIFWLLLIGISLFYSMGDHIFINQIISNLPGMSFLRVPGRIIFLTGLAAAILSAHFVDYMREEKLTIKEIKVINLSLAALIIFESVITASVYFMTKEFPFEFFWGLVFCSLYFIIVKLISLNKKNYLAAGLIFIIILDLGGVNYLGINFRSINKVNSEGAEAAVFVSNQPGLFRVYSPSYSIPQHTAALFNLQLADGIDPLQLISYSRFMEKASGVPQNGYSVSMPPYENGNPKTANEGYIPDTAFLGLLNVRYVISAFPLFTKGLNLVEQNGTGYIYENEKCLPRAWVQAADKKTGEGIISIPEISSTPNEIFVNADGPGLLVLSEISYPGWRAELNGEPTKIDTKDIFRSLLLKEGKNEVHLYYYPTLALLGLGLSTTTIFFLFIIPTIKRRKQVNGKEK